MSSWYYAKVLGEESLPNASESKEGAMVLVESALALHPSWQRAKQETDSTFLLGSTTGYLRNVCEIHSLIYLALCDRGFSSC